MSEQWIAAESTCEWWNSIEGFAASPRWIPKGTDTDGGKGKGIT